MTSNKEIWLPIKEYEDHYEVSNMGRIRSIDRILQFDYATGGTRFHKGKIKKSTRHYKNKYHSVMLKFRSIEKRVLVHRLVAEHFLPNPNNKPEVNHKKGNKDDNRASQLEWATALENTTHSIKIGLTPNRRKPVSVKKNNVYIEFDSLTKAARHIKTTVGWVGRCALSGRLVKGYFIKYI